MGFVALPAAAQVGLDSGARKWTKSQAAS